MCVGICIYAHLYLCVCLCMYAFITVWQDQYNYDSKYSFFGWRSHIIDSFLLNEFLILKGVTHICLNSSVRKMFKTKIMTFFLQVQFYFIWRIRIKNEFKSSQSFLLI